MSNSTDISLQLLAPWRICNPLGCSSASGGEFFYKPDLEEVVFRNRTPDG